LVVAANGEVVYGEESWSLFVGLTTVYLLFIDYLSFSRSAYPYTAIFASSYNVDSS